MSQQSDSPSLAWLLIFADLAALMLSFFVLLLSMTSVERGHWQAIVDSLTVRLNPARLTPEREAETDNAVPRVAIAPGLDLDYLTGVLIAKLRTAPALADLTYAQAGDRLVLTLPGHLLFAAGEARMLGEGRARLALVGDALRGLPNRVEVVGHSDPVAPRAVRFSSNWELSLARAAAVANELTRAGYARPIGVFGLGDSRFGDIDPALPLAERHRLARRVDIVVRVDGDRGHRNAD